MLGLVARVPGEVKMRALDVPGAVARRHDLPMEDPIADATERMAVRFTCKQKNKKEEMVRVVFAVLGGMLVM